MTPDRDSELDSVMKARENLRRRMSGKSGTESNNSGKKPNIKVESEEDEAEESKKEIKKGRTWVSISNKVDKKALNAVIVNKDEDANKVNLEAEMSKYLGGDDEVLKGFYESDEEIQFDSIDMN